MVSLGSTKSQSSLDAPTINNRASVVKDTRSPLRRAAGHECPSLSSTLPPSAHLERWFPPRLFVQVCRQSQPPSFHTLRPLIPPHRCLAVWLVWYLMFFFLHSLRCTAKPVRAVRLSPGTLEPFSSYNCFENIFLFRYEHDTSDTNSTYVSVVTTYYDDFSVHALFMFRSFKGHLFDYHDLVNPSLAKIQYLFSCLIQWVPRLNRGVVQAPNKLS